MREAVIVSYARTPFTKALCGEFNLLSGPELGGLSIAAAVERAGVEGSVVDDVVQGCANPYGRNGGNIARLAAVRAGLPVTVGLGIAISVLNSGRAASVVDRSEEVLQRGRAYIAKYYAGQQQKGRISEGDAAVRQARLHASTQMQALANVDVVIEAVFEDYAVKEAVLHDIAAHVRSDTIIATNTSALNVNRLANSVNNTGRFVGLHFFSPANVMRLVEVVRSDVTSETTLARSFALVKALGKLPVLAGVCDGFIGNRMYAKYNAAANELINMGASPEQIDTALERFGFAMGIFKVGDLAGLELSWAGRKRRAQESPCVDYSVFADRLCEAGRYGQKTGAGWYRYEAANPRIPLHDPRVHEMITAWRESR